MFSCTKNILYLTYNEVPSGTLMKHGYTAHMEEEEKKGRAKLE
jgi:hypothetical protein